MCTDRSVKAEYWEGKGYILPLNFFTKSEVLYASLSRIQAILPLLHT
ncbi:hypothetical protein KCTCHS21_35870 [Cohnella abietis]|uniref:Uncharacterized protein n=1 Tax=Cohnella abietis TaxID=2507935 RepID=A0A3T1D7Z1_9BACL|nr:hypothetical protein KCTCHS21_35870 [Cohnella abietis]